MAEKKSSSTKWRMPAPMKKVATMRTGIGGMVERAEKVEGVDRTVGAW